ncbi:ABC transporter permease, partial [Candidatus Saccharibacteria bacterium]|nr:ABC transporter permease [Candidatus Saccharibacteria bacterium]
MISIRKGYLNLALQSLRNARTRSLMTMLGIIISVVSVVVIVSIGEGVKQQIGNQAARYGKDVLIVRPEQSTSGLGGTGLPGGSSALLSSDDMNVVRTVPGVSDVVPLSVVTGEVSGDFNVKNPLVIATTPGLANVLNQEIQYGGFFAESDGQHVAVLGPDVARELFSDNAPLAQKVQFRGQQFLVAGIFQPFVAAPFSLEANYNNAIFIPYSSAQQLLKTAPQINQMFVKTDNDSDARAVAAALEDALRTAHGGANTVVVLTPGDKAAGSNQTLDLLTLMTVGIAIVALVVGGVGIMNMMLVSVTERIHEIGLRKAIGATNRQILRQFITEAIALCGVGAMLGFVASIATIELIRLYTTLQPVIVWPVAV